jgi:hypothetical protein
MNAGRIGPFLEFTTRADAGGTWRVYDPSGHQIMFYGPELDGALAPELATAHAREENFKLRFLADFLTDRLDVAVSRELLIEALAACRAEVDQKVAGGAL